MNIKLNDRYTITSDESNYMLNEIKEYGVKSKTPGEIYSVVVGYYAKIEHLAKDLLELKIRKSDIKTLEDIISTLNNDTQLILSTIQGH